MILLRGYIYSWLLVSIFASAVMGQDSVTVAKKQNALYLTIDYGKLAEMAINDQVKWEFGLGAVFLDHFNLTLEYGYGKLLPENAINNGSYTSEGNYYRGGFDYVFQVTPKRFLSAGALYAYSGFDDEGQVIIESEIWDNLDKTFQRTGLSAQWMEIVINTEGPVFKSDSGFMSNIFWGTKFRLRIMLTESDTEEFDIYAVPGFGKRFSDVVPALNLFLKYRFPLN